MTTPIHVVCPSCDAVNRIPENRIQESPQCGKCHSSLMPTSPPELHGDRFVKHLNRNDLPVVVDFWAEWCGPCKAMAPEFTRSALDLKSDARLVKLNTEQDAAAAARYAIRSIPTMILFRGGQEVARQSGAMRAADITRWVRTHSGPGRGTAA